MRSLKKILLATAMAAAASPCFGGSTPTVYLMKIADHRALDETVRGVRDALAGRDIKIRVESAQGNPSTALQIAQKIAAKKPAVAVAVGTVAAQSLANYANRIEDPVPIVYSSVTDPKSAGLIPAANVTGVSNFVPLRPQLELFRKLQPNLETIGIAYNPGEANSVAIVNALKPICEEMGIGLVLRAATRTAEMPQAAAELARRVDAIFVSNDNTALAALAAIVGVADSQGIPVYVSDRDAVALGALAALGPNQREVGRQTGRMVAKILDGETADSIAPEWVTSMTLSINLPVAERLSIAVSEELLSEAEELIQ
ncbi:MAG: ABC transporter substrate-binding protein [Puniceicoccales bacterium]|jgi:putative ABC transport system substrate-binding protein|nr:ABC transporter substrate-binding protein [Puniceicoccales bacterium]